MVVNERALPRRHELHGRDSIGTRSFAAPVPRLLQNGSPLPHFRQYMRAKRVLRPSRIGIARSIGASIVAESGATLAQHNEIFLNVIDALGTEQAARILLRVPDKPPVILEIVWEDGRGEDLKDRHGILRREKTTVNTHRRL